MLLEGKVALVSGIGPGMGRDIATLFARNGADLVLGARRDKHTTRVAGEVAELGRKAIPVTLDITDRAQCDAAVEAAVEQLGRLDILVNNAFHDGDFTEFADADLDGWRTAMDVNLWGTLGLTQAAVPALAKSGDGRVIMVNSMAAARIQGGFGAYAASKAALATATKTLARELGRRGIRVNAIHPGYIWSPKQEWYLNHLAEQHGVSYEEEKAALEAETCLGYLPHSSEIAGSVLFFASELSKPVTGQALHVNAGHWFGSFE